jgi:hypothetical protein
MRVTRVMVYDTVGVRQRYAANQRMIDHRRRHGHGNTVFVTYASQDDGGAALEGREFRFELGWEVRLRFVWIV